MYMKIDFWRPIDPLDAMPTFLNRYTSREHLRKELIELEKRIRSGDFLYGDERMMVADLLATMIKQPSKPARLSREVKIEVLQVLVAKFVDVATPASTYAGAKLAAQQTYNVTAEFVNDAMNRYNRERSYREDFGAITSRIL